MLCLTTILHDHEASWQPLLRAVEDATTLTAMLVAVWPLARCLACAVLEAVLADRAQRPTIWPPCPVCGTGLHSQGFVMRHVTSLFGPLQWRRRVGRCPRGCAIPAVAPCDTALDLPPHQRSSGDLQALGCALAVFVPFATAASGLAAVASDDIVAVLGFLMIAGFFSAAYNGPIYAVIVTIAGPHLRGLAVSAVQLSANLIGVGLGAWLIGKVSDVVGGKDGASAANRVVSATPCRPHLLVNRLCLAISLPRRYRGVAEGDAPAGCCCQRRYLPWHRQRHEGAGFAAWTMEKHAQ